MKRIDLHVHTTASDSTASPAEAVRLAKEAGLSAIAITDHDTVSGYAEAAEAGKKYGGEVVPGIEISTKYGRAVHILGYYIDPDSDKLAPVLEWVVHDRDERNRKMAELMAADGLPVSYEEMHRRFGAVICDPPAFAKSRRALDAAYRGYKELNLRCMQMLEPGGFLLTCSCSQFMTQPLFEQMLREAAADSGRSVRLLERLMQSRDHPAALAEEHAAYLKGCILQAL